MLGIIHILHFGVQSKTRDIPILLVIVALTLLRIILNWRLNHSPWQGILEGLLMWVLYRSGQFVLGQFRSFFASGLLFGLMVASILGILSVWFIQPKSWRVESWLATQTKFDKSRRFEAIEPSNAWVLQLLGFQGSGSVRYSAEFKASKPSKVMISLLHDGLKGNRVDMPCEIQTQWTSCQIRAVLPKRALLTFVIGGYGTWKRGDPAIEVRNDILDIVEPPTLLERISNAPRAKLWAFNENAFGVWVAVLGIFAFGLINRFGVIMISGLFLISSVFISGSRGAFAAFSVGIVLLIYKNIKFFNLLLITATFFVVDFTVWQICQQSNSLLTAVTIDSGLNNGFRAIQPNDSSSARSRLEIFRLAWLAFQDSPLLGVGDLQKAMISKLDARAKNAGLSRENITHSHNLWLQVAGESGVFGLFIMVFLWFFVVWQAWKRIDRLALICFAVIFLVNLSDYFFYYAPVQIVFWMSVSGFLPKNGDDTIQISNRNDFVS